MGSGDVCLLTVAHGRLDQGEQCPSSNNLTEPCQVLGDRPVYRILPKGVPSGSHRIISWCDVRRLGVRKILHVLPEDIKEHVPHFKRRNGDSDINLRRHVVKVLALFVPEVHGGTDETKGHVRYIEDDALSLQRRSLVDREWERERLARGVVEYLRDGEWAVWRARDTDAFLSLSDRHAERRVDIHQRDKSGSSEEEVSY